MKTAPKSIYDKWFQTKAGAEDKFLERELGVSGRAIRSQIISLDDEIRSGLFKFDFGDDDFNIEYNVLSGNYQITRKQDGQ